jgi:hypothetical protein
MDGVSTSELHVMYILTLDSDQIFDKARIVNCALMS